MEISNMSSFLMWEYQGRQVGEFHSAASAAARTKMLAKGFFDATGQQSWALPYPTTKAFVPPKQTKPAAPATPAPAVDAPVDATVQSTPV